MASTVKLDLAKIAQLGSKGILLEHSQDGEKTGDLMIGKASLVWFPKGRRNKGHKVSWEQLQDWLTEQPLTSATRPG